MDAKRNKERAYTNDDKATAAAAQKAEEKAEIRLAKIVTIRRSVVRNRFSLWWLRVI